MTELVKSYLGYAIEVKKRMDEIAQLMKKAIDIEELKSLRARYNLLQDERYEILGVASEMIRLYGEQKRASGEY